ncbi:hypothetical protein [Meiothermus granaticius]|uniref:Uncharacterized protein n=1 Tax=Meiothermus granaticius NBRC 107808 TaxID=1227551 RepID=A0A399F964_9DEIN|nr:hypothetical protein [Meiothermus granaticius]RIH91171.1 hypothetical protein Mgrana_02955 [Meiothermus granaticius NBRC 107808]GEM88371.1 hypothetical protein MGR01S_29960 [Meiothermus granaticius NBRC 107808]
MKLRFHRTVRDKIWQKHQVRLYEVLEAIRDPRRRTFVSHDEPEGRVYLLLGRSEAGRLLRIIFISRRNGNWMKTALDAYERDKKAYNKK